MILEHVAIWTNQLEELKLFYQTYFHAIPGERYTNEANRFHSYFLFFSSGARLELMTKPGLLPKGSNPVERQHLGLIHLAFALDRMADVDAKAAELRAAGFPILRGPRITGDGYYEFESLDPDGNLLEVGCAYKPEPLASIAVACL